MGRTALGRPWNSPIASECARSGSDLKFKTCRNSDVSLPSPLSCLAVSPQLVSAIGCHLLQGGAFIYPEPSAFKEYLHFFSSSSNGAPGCEPVVAVDVCLEPLQ
ncbi:hypothetical protein DY000_02013845 [Brassica cretica]|uniref:Uncharacterized protein n=1 Tax=Brassica cretica TaxID=69181 RepID=A0ABQ7D797_BRACR|nr:hypothetical protein DY000_02013845 [Brassica cretica]